MNYNNLNKLLTVKYNFFNQNGGQYYMFVNTPIEQEHISIESAFIFLNGYPNDIRNY